MDLQHDFLEGICRYDVSFILHNFIYVRKYFTLDHFNEIIRGFYYGSDYHINKPPEISELHLKNKYIVLSSAEMLNLVRNLNLMIGLLIDESDEYWQILLMLQQILEIVLSKNVTLETPTLLELKIHDYLTFLSKELPNGLKPKHHFLVHYPSVMRKVGPLWHISCMKFESKHREGKRTSHSSICRVNICRTIALKHQLILNYRFLSKNSTYPCYTCGRIRKVPIHSLPSVTNFIQLLPVSERQSQQEIYNGRSAGRQYWCPHWHMSGMITMFYTGLPVLFPHWLLVLAFGTGAVLAYVGHDNDL